MTKTTRSRPAAGSEACARSDAALVRAFELLGRRWTGVILGTLSDRSASFRELARTVPGIGDSMLSTRLASLTEAGLVTRTVDGVRPSRSPTSSPTPAARCSRRSSRSAAGPTSTCRPPRRLRCHGQGSSLRLSRDRPMIVQPRQHVAGVAIRRKHRIEDVADARVVDDQRQPLEQGEAHRVHGRQAQGPRQHELLVRQDRERQMQPGRQSIRSLPFIVLAPSRCGRLRRGWLIPDLARGLRAAFAS